MEVFTENLQLNERLLHSKTSSSSQTSIQRYSVDLNQTLKKTISLIQVSYDDSRKVSHRERCFMPNSRSFVFGEQ